MYHQQPGAPPVYSPGEFSGQQTHEKQPYHETSAIVNQGLSSSCFQVRPGWKIGHLYRVRPDSSSSYHLIGLDGKPVHTITIGYFSTADILIYPYHQTVPDPLPPSLASCKLHAFHSHVDLCLGDYKSMANPWDTYRLRKDYNFVKKNERWRWGIEPSVLPPQLRVVHPGRNEKNHVEFVWRRAADSVTALSSWELVLDRDGSGDGEVLMRYKLADMSLKKKGELEIVEGLGEQWELLAFMSLYTISFHKEPDYVGKYVKESY